jgi:mannitol-specific phosphotransferase system IIBC component
MRSGKLKFLFFLLAVPVVLSVLVVLFPVNVSAQESASPSAVASESAEITYQLAYPGLLPDHPLYFLKAARDKIISFFISSPIKKADFDLLQADKRIGASVMLSKKGKVDLAQSTFSKAENYFEKAIVQVSSAKMQGIHTGEMAKKLQDANLKHRQVLDDMLKELDQEDQDKFVMERERLVRFGEKVKVLKPEK